MRQMFPLNLFARADLRHGERKLTFSSRALWCSNSDFRALRTSTSLETPDGGGACRFTTVILKLRSWRDTRHSRCSSNSCSAIQAPPNQIFNSNMMHFFISVAAHLHRCMHTHTLVLFLSAFSSDISSSFSSSCSRHMFSSFVRVANSYTETKTPTHRSISSGINILATPGCGQFILWPESNKASSMMSLRGFICLWQQAKLK